MLLYLNMTIYFLYIDGVLIRNTGNAIFFRAGV